MTPEATIALLMLQKDIERGDDPLETAGYLAAVGNFMLARLGFEMKDKPEVQVEIDTEEHPGEASITLTWQLPETASPDAPEED